MAYQIVGGPRMVGGRGDQVTERARHWVRLVAEQEASGLSAAAWCRRRGVQPSTLSWWRGELRRRRRRGATNLDPEFVQVRITAAGDAPGVRVPLRLRMGRAEVVIEGDFDEALLRKVLDVLESRRC